MKIQILLSTMNVNDVKEIFKKTKYKNNAIIVNQGMSKYVEQEYKNLKMYSYTDKGLSKSRNKLIEKATGEICIITDDDVTFRDDYNEELINFYKKTGADIITFNYLKGEKIIGPTKIKKHNILSLLSISSIQISFDLKEIKNKGITFDENFGLGSKFKSGEENIFLINCYRAGLKIIHLPIIVCEHVDEKTTGEYWDKDLIKSKGALFYKLFRGKNYIFCLYLMIFKYKYYKIYCNPYEFLKIYNEGIKEIRGMK